MNRIKTSVLACFLLSSIATTWAQSWTLDSCINYAISNNIDVRARSIERQSAEYDIIEAKDRFLPQVNAGASQSFDFGRGLTSSNIYADRNTSNFMWNVGLSLPIFQGLSAKRQLDLAKANLASMIENIEAVKDDVTLRVMSQYLQVLYCGELHEIAIEQERISQIELKRQEDLFEAGKIPELDLTQVRAQLAQDQLTTITTANDRKIALVDLAHLLQLTDIDNFDIAPLPESETILPDASTILANALEINHSLKASALNITTAEKQISLAKSGYYNVSGTENPSFGTQMRENFNKSIGFTLSIPIFDAFATRNSIRKAEIQKLNAELRYDDAKTQLQKAIQQAYYQAEAAIAKHKAGITAREAANVAMNAMQEKFNFGRANATEFEQAKPNYIKTSAEAAQAKYEPMLRIRILQFYNSGR